jgi:hypothetical protein
MKSNYNYYKNNNNSSSFNKNNQTNWTKGNNRREINFGIEIESEEKYELLNYIYEQIDMNNIKYSILKTIDNAQILKQQPFHVALHFHGYNYFLIIKKLKYEVNFYIVSKLDLKNNRNEINDKYIKIYKLKLNDNIVLNNIEIYDNSIIDGKLIYKKNERIFLINDILYYKSIRLLSMRLIDKLKSIDSDIFTINYYINNNFNLILIKLYEYSELEDLIYNKIQNSDFKINGLIFLPHRTGKYYIYINDNEFDIIKNSPISIKNNITNIKLPNNINIDESELLLEKTNIIDVYEVYNIEKTHRFGIAAVPDMILSHKLRLYFESNNQLITKCIYNKKFLKWQPSF